jgi:hypothetical protein
MRRFVVLIKLGEQASNISASSESLNKRRIASAIWPSLRDKSLPCSYDDNTIDKTKIDVTGQTMRE